MGVLRIVALCKYTRVNMQSLTTNTRSDMSVFVYNCTNEKSEEGIFNIINYKIIHAYNSS